VRDEPAVQAAKSLFHTGCSIPGAGVPLGVPLVTCHLCAPLVSFLFVVFHTIFNTYTQRGVSPMRRAACCIVSVLLWVMV
jgi:hypothetical protein